jgi:hypothetical protein
VPESYLRAFVTIQHHYNNHVIVQIAAYFS